MSYAHVFALATVSIVVGACQSTPTIQTSEPKPGTIQAGQVVYVDDGTCGGGQVKKITGGSNRRNIPRKTECVARPG